MTESEDELHGARLGRLDDEKLTLFVGLGLAVLIAAALGVLVLLGIAPWFVPVFALITGVGAAFGASRRRRGSR